MYDHVSFHIDDLPADLPVEYAVHHMGFYYAWAVAQHLHSDAAACLAGFEDLRSGSLSGAEFILQQLNGGLDETCFNDLGNRFTQYYYADDDEGYGFFLQDYFVALNLQNEADFYRVENNDANQTQLNRVFQAAFDRWKGSLKA